MRKLLSTYVIVGYLAFLQRGLITISQATIGVAVTLIALHLAITLISIVEKNK